VDEAKPSARLARDLVLYTLARLVLAVALTAAILGIGELVHVRVPLLVAMLFALVIALPLSLFVFKSLRGRVAEGIAAVDEHRRQDKAALRARLRGEVADQ
jgi:hypothetical protein